MSLSVRGTFEPRNIRTPAVIATLVLRLTLLAILHIALPTPSRVSKLFDSIHIGGRGFTSRVSGMYSVVIA